MGHIRERERDYKTFIVQLPTSGYSLLICIKIGERGGNQGRGSSEAQERILNTRSDYDFAGDEATGGREKAGGSL